VIQSIAGDVFAGDVFAGDVFAGDVFAGDVYGVPASPGDSSGTPLPVGCRIRAESVRNRVDAALLDSALITAYGDSRIQVASGDHAFK